MNQKYEVYNTIYDSNSGDVGGIPGSATPSYYVQQSQDSQEYLQNNQSPLIKPFPKKRTTLKGNFPVLFQKQTGVISQYSLLTVLFFCPEYLLPNRSRAFSAPQVPEEDFAAYASHPTQASKYSQG